MEYVSLIESWNFEVDHFKDYLWSKELCLLGSFLNNQLLVSPVNVILQVFPFISLEILSSDNECMSDCANQIIPHSLSLDWSHVFVVLTFLLNSFDDYDACTVCHQLQENGLSHSASEEVDSIVQIIRKDVQIGLSLLITNWESDA